MVDNEEDELLRSLFGKGKEKTEEKVETEKPKEEEKPEEKPEEEKPEEKPKPVKREIPKEEFDYSEDKGTGKLVVTIYGLKGHGKTFLAFSFPGKIDCLSFDKKSLPIKKQLKNNNIRVYDAVRYIDKSSPEAWLESADKSFIYLNNLIDRLDNPDWIIIDGSEIFQRICEMTMRYRNNLMPFQGIANRNLWKERRLYISQIHTKALKKAKKGVIYTAYTDKDKIIIDGEVIIEKDIPKWVDAIMYETDIVIKVESEQDGPTRKFYAIVESSKGLLPTGIKKEVTNVGIKAYPEMEKVI